MLLDLGVTSEIPSTDFIKTLTLAEKGAFNCLWIGEDIDKPHDVFIQASHALMRTTLKVGIGITSVYARNVSNIARAAVCLSETGNNRFRLGVGVGGLQNLSKMGISVKKPLQTLREATALLRRIWKGETVTFESENFHLKNYYARYGLGQEIPLYFGVRGSRMLELAGEVADGVILSGPRSYLKKAVEIVRSSARKTGRLEDPCFVVWLPTVLISKNEDLKLAKRVVAFVLADTPRSVLELSGIEWEIAEEIQGVSARKGIDVAAKLVTDEVLNEMILYGNSRELCESFLSLEKYGVNEAVFGPPFGVDRSHAIKEVVGAWGKAQ